MSQHSIKSKKKEVILFTYLTDKILGHYLSINGDIWQFIKRVLLVNWRWFRIIQSFITKTHPLEIPHSKSYKLICNKNIKQSIDNNNQNNKYSLLGNGKEFENVYMGLKGNIDLVKRMLDWGILSSCKQLLLSGADQDDLIKTIMESGIGGVGGEIGHQLSTQIKKLILINYNGYPAILSSGVNGLESLYYSTYLTAESNGEKQLSSLLQHHSSTLKEFTLMLRGEVNAVNTVVNGILGDKGVITTLNNLSTLQLIHRFDIKHIRQIKNLPSLTSLTLYDTETNTFFINEVDEFGRFLQEVDGMVAKRLLYLSIRPALPSYLPLLKSKIQPHQQRLRVLELYLQPGFNYHKIKLPKNIQQLTVTMGMQHTKGVWKKLCEYILKHKLPNLSSLTVNVLGSEFSDDDANDLWSAVANSPTLVNFTFTKTNSSISKEQSIALSRMITHHICKSATSTYTFTIPHLPIQLSQYTPLFLYYPHVVINTDSDCQMVRESSIPFHHNPTITTLSNTTITTITSNRLLPSLIIIKNHHPTQQ